MADCTTIPGAVEQMEKRTVVEKNYQKVTVSEITPELHFYAQKADQVPEIKALMLGLRQELNRIPPPTESYTPMRGDWCAVKDTVDGEWYRSKVENVTDGQVSVLYIDYGKRKTTTTDNCAALPACYIGQAPYAQEFALACVALPEDPEVIAGAIGIFDYVTRDRQLLLSVECKGAADILQVTLLTDDAERREIVRDLVEDGFVHVERRQEEDLRTLVEDYIEAENVAKERQWNIWRYFPVNDGFTCTYSSDCSCCCCTN